MSKESFNIEELFQQTFDKHGVNPSKEALKGLRKKLWKRDFFSLKFSQFNIYYTILLLGGLSTGYFLYNQSDVEDNATVQSNNVQNEKNRPVTEEPINDNSKKEPEVRQTEIKEKEPKEEIIIPEADFSMSTVAGCAPLKVQLRNRSKNAETLTWYVDDEKEISSESTTEVFKEPGIYKVQLQAISVSGHVDQEIKEITVYGKPEAKLAIDDTKSSNPQKIIQFVNNSNNAVKYFWLFGDGETSSEKEPKHKYDAYQSYDVTLIATSEHGCKDTSKLTAHFLKEQYGLSYPQNFVPSPQGPGNNGYYKRADWPDAIFHPQYNGIKEYSLTIKTPNGLEVFYTKDIDQGWNGYIRGRLAPIGEYIWHAKGEYMNGEEFSLRGKVSVKHEGIRDSYGY